MDFICLSGHPQWMIHFNEVHGKVLTSLLQGSQNNFLENSIDFSSRVIIICGSTKNVLIKDPKF